MHLHRVALQCVVQVLHAAQKAHDPICTSTAAASAPRSQAGNTRTIRPRGRRVAAARGGGGASARAAALRRVLREPEGHVREALVRGAGHPTITRCDRLFVSDRVTAGDRDLYRRRFVPR
jgi:hypothetical protein